MKLYGTLSIAIVALVAASFTNKKGESIKNTTDKEKSVVFTLEKKKSSLAWKGSKSEDYFHVGTVNFSEGSVQISKGELMSGSFTVNMNSINVTDDMPEGKISYLTKHLQSEDFFNTAKFPSVTVDVSGYKDGILSAKLNVMGVALEQEIPVELVISETEVTIKGEFDLDLGMLAIPGFQVDEESGESISSTINYKLNLTLSK